MVCSRVNSNLSLRTVGYCKTLDPYERLEFCPLVSFLPIFIKNVNKYEEFDVVLTVHRRYYVEIKCQLDATDDFLLQILLLAQHITGTIMPIIRSSRVSSPQTGHITLSSTPYRQLENQAPNTTGSNHLYNTLELLMMGIMVPRNMLSKQ